MFRHLHTIGRRKVLSACETRYSIDVVTTFVRYILFMDIFPHAGMLGFFRPIGAVDGPVCRLRVGTEKTGAENLVKTN
tara:strand:+ start:477 stop:710 length:234 start_codon:yes stop_codon:yes gene_type:complete